MEEWEEVGGKGSRLGVNDGVAGTFRDVLDKI